MSLLEKTLPVNLFPPVFLLSNGEDRAKTQS